MNGRVVAVLVKPGEQVAAGQPVMTLEAMKMEHVHTAGVAGTMSAIDVAEGEQVTTGKIVVEIEAARRNLRRPGQAKRTRVHATCASTMAAARCPTMTTLWVPLRGTTIDLLGRPVPSLSQHATWCFAPASASAGRSTLQRSIT